MTSKIAVITGASRGVGKAVAKHLARSNFHTVLLARNEKLLNEITNEINDAGNSASYFCVDVSNNLQVSSCVKEIINKHKKIHLLINNAAILKRGTTDLSDEETDELLKINLNGAIYVAKYVAEQMKRQREGYIINISSLGGKQAASFAGIYAASKFGLSGFSEALTKEMSLYNIKVTNICPSMIATEMANGRKFQPHEMIQLSDLTKTIDYLLGLSSNAIPTEVLISCMPLIKTLLGLSSNAIPTEVLISCMPLIKKTTEMLQTIYLN